jgi:hypothetical protein
MTEAYPCGAVPVRKSTPEALAASACAASAASSRQRAAAKGPSVDVPEGVAFRPLRSASRPPQVKRRSHETVAPRGRTRRCADCGSQGCLAMSSGNNGWVVPTDEVPLRSPSQGIALAIRPCPKGHGEAEAVRREARRPAVPRGPQRPRSSLVQSEAKEDTCRQRRTAVPTHGGRLARRPKATTGRPRLFRGTPSARQRRPQR